MNEDELLSAIKDKLIPYRRMSFDELSTMEQLASPCVFTLGSLGNDDYLQGEIDVVVDDKISINTRVMGIIDNGRNLYGSYSLIISPDGNLVSEGGAIQRRGNSIFRSALNLFVLRELPFSRFNFPRWQAVLSVSTIGLLVGLDPSFRAAPPGVSAPPLWLALLAGLVLTWVGFLVIVVILRWWLKRGGRWDGDGDLFNLVAAAWLVTNTLGAGLTALGMPPLLTLPLWLYSVWVGAQAMESAIPKASLGYCIGGIAIGLVPAVLASALVVVLIGLAMAGLGLAPSGVGA